MGAPYDTLRTAIGISGSAHGSLRDYGVAYAQVDTLDGGARPGRHRARRAGDTPRRRPCAALPRL